MNNPEEFDLRPLTIEKVFGLRAFKPTDEGTLKPVSMPATQTGFLWESGENIAKCVMKVHIPAVLGCKCGFWAYTDGSNEYHFNPTSVQGIIEASGRMVIGTKGFRAEKARIVVLVEPDSDTIINHRIEKRFNMFIRKHPDIPVVPNVDAALFEFPVSKIRPSDFRN